MTWQQFFDTYINIAPGIQEIALRLACAMFIGIIIGLEREFTHRPAGLRTHILVVLGACVVSITGEMLFFQYHATGATPDPARLSAQVITGVGFLGAGTIMKEGINVKGLTTAASVWTVASLGIAVGYGYYAIAAAGLVLAFITLTILEIVQNHLPGRTSPNEEYALDCEDVAVALQLVHEQAQKHRGEVRQLLAQRTETGYHVTFHAFFPGIGSKRRQENFFTALAAAQEVRSLQRGNAPVHQTTP